jgi:hypothetical protein
MLLKPIRWRMIYMWREWLCPSSNSGVKFVIEPPGLYFIRRNTKYQKQIFPSKDYELLFSVNSFATRFITAGQSLFAVVPAVPLCLYCADSRRRQYRYLPSIVHRISAGQRCLTKLPCLMLSMTAIHVSQLAMLVRSSILIVPPC